MQPSALMLALHAELGGHGVGTVQIAVPEVLPVLLYHCMPVACEVEVELP